VQPRPIVALAAALALLAGPRAASAQQCATAACHIDRGLEARTRNADDEAVRHFEAAVALDRTPRGLAQLALAEQALGRWVAAEAHLREAVAADDPWIEEHRDVLDDAMATIRRHLGRLTISANVDGAEARVNGRPVGALPLDAPVWVEVGTAIVELSAPGYVDVRRQAEITAGGLARVHAELVADAPASSDQGDASDPGDATDPGDTHIADPSLPRRSGDGPSPWGILTAVGLGLTAAALGGTIAALVVREGHVMRWNDPAECPAGGPMGRATECPDVPGSWATAEDWAIGLGVLTGALAAATITFVVLAAVEGDDDGPARVELEVAPGALRARGRF